MRRESNPALAAGFEKAVSDGTTMTVGGTIVKILIMTAILGVAFVYSWIAFQNPDVNYKSALVVSLGGSLILGHHSYQRLHSLQQFSMQLLKVFF